MPSNLRIEDISRLNKIQKKKGWIHYEGSEYVFEKFCQLLDNLDEEQKNLILELIERYTWVHIKEYFGKLTSILDKIDNTKLLGVKSIFFFPIVKEEETEVTKSGNSLIYNLKGLKPLLSKFKDIEFIILEQYDEVKNIKVRDKNDFLFILIDDYMGSGTTFNKVLTKLLSINGDLMKVLNVLAIVSHQKTINILEKSKIPYYVDLITNKGISDFYEEPKLSANIRLMKNIEKILVSKRFSLGFNQTEDLVTLQRTPNNTFPIFWEKHKIKGVEFDAPFSRY